MRTAPVWAWSAAIAVAGVAVYATMLAGLQPAIASPHLAWWSLAGVFFLAEAFPVHVDFRSETHTLSLSEVGIVIGLFVATPLALLLGLVVGAGVALVCVRRQRPLKIAFNIAQFGLSTACAVVVFRQIASLGDPHGPVAWLAAAAGAGTFGIVSIVLVTTTIALAAGRPSLDELPETLVLAVAASLASASFAIAAVEMLIADTRSVWLLGIPAVCWGLAFRAYGHQRRRHEHLEFLYGTMRAMQGAGELRSAVRELLIAARTMLSADYAEILLFDDLDDERVLRSVVAPAREALMEPVELSEAAAAAVAAVGSERHRAALLPRGRMPHAADAYLAEQGLDDALLTTLRRDQRVLGLLVVANRSGDVSTFTNEDRTLFETFAGHAGVLLENDQVKEQLRYQAFHDALTGLPNRTFFTQRVAEALADARNRATVLFVDLDDFKTINDTLGHSAGDELLVAVAERVRACVRPGDLAARLGGDEFGILLERGNADAAEAIAKRLVTMMQAPFLLDGREMPIHASIGIAGRSQGARTADELLSNADIAMYSAKANGKRRYASYEPQMHMRIRRTHELARALEQAVRQDEISVRYQPIVALADGRPAAVEALVRWEHPLRGLLAPGTFLPLAEERGLMWEIGRHVLETACAQAAEWQAVAGLEQLPVTVNLSPTELLRRGLAEEVQSVLRRTGLAPESLIVEITESAAMVDLSAALAAMHELRAVGVRLALDDFGTGYSALSHLRDFPIDTLKIAKPFVDRLDRGPGDTTFVDAILRLATTLDLHVVAEGIERADQAVALRRLECGLGQGYYFARPLDAADARAYLGGSALPGRRRIRAA